MIVVEFKDETAKNIALRGAKTLRTTADLNTNKGRPSSLEYLNTMSKNFLTHHALEPTSSPQNSTASS